MKPLLMAVLFLPSALCSQPSAHLLAIRVQDVFVPPGQFQAKYSSPIDKWLRNKGAGKVTNPYFSHDSAITKFHADYIIIYAEMIDLKRDLPEFKKHLLSIKLPRGSEMSYIQSNKVHVVQLAGS